MQRGQHWVGKLRHEAGLGEMWVLKEVVKMLFLTANRPFPFLERLFAGWWAEGGTAFKCI